MAIADEQPNPKTVLHPVYTGTKVTYSQWMKLFTLHTKGYYVTCHIDGTPPPCKTDPDYEEWTEIDAHVLRWIYGTVSDDIIGQIPVSESTALEAWLRLKNHFHNNTGSRIAALKHEFNNLTLVSMLSLDEYRQRLKDIAGQLMDVGRLVSDQRLVLQLVRGLPAEYDTLGALINQTLPDLETARSMLRLESQGQSARPDPSSAALVAPTVLHQDTFAPAWQDHTSAPCPPSRGGLRGNHSRCHNTRRGGHQNNGSGNRPHNGNGGRDYVPPPAPTGSPYTNPYWPQPPYQQRTPPPCPYLTQPGWTTPWFLGQPQSSAQPSGQAYVAEAHELEPSSIGQAFQAMSLHTPDDS